MRLHALRPSLDQQIDLDLGEVNGRVTVDQHTQGIPGMRTGNVRDVDPYRSRRHAVRIDLVHLEGCERTARVLDSAHDQGVVDASTATDLASFTDAAAPGERLRRPRRTA